jgi:tRNA-dihydrouridine synthase
MSFWQLLTRPVIGMAPMDGVTDAPFRHTVAMQGKPDVSFTEFTHVHDVCRGPEFLLDSLIYHEAERPIVAQLYGKEPDLFYQAAHAVCELGFDGLDINMGCPSRSVASSGSGAGLIRTPDVAQAIMQATRQGIADWAAGQTLEGAGLKPGRVAAIRRLNGQRQDCRPLVRQRIPLSVKTRLGYDVVIVDRWIEHLLVERPALISLHGRTLQQMYRGEADWNAIARAAEIVQGSGTLLFGNGDVHSYHDVIRRVRDAGVDGVLVGRAALGSPWFFRQKRRRDSFCSNICPKRGLSRGFRSWTIASRCCSIMRDGLKRSVGRASFGECANTWAGTAKDFLMPPRFEPICFESPRLPIWSRCLPIFACATRV